MTRNPKRWAAAAAFTLLSGIGALATASPAGAAEYDYHCMAVVPPERTVLVGGFGCTMAPGDPTEDIMVRQLDGARTYLCEQVTPMIAGIITGAQCTEV